MCDFQLNDLVSEWNDPRRTNKWSKRTIIRSKQVIVEDHVERAR